MLDSGAGQVLPNHSWLLMHSAPLLALLGGCHLTKRVDHRKELLLPRDKDTLTTEDLAVVPPEVCQLGRPLVGFISVGCQNEPGRRKFKGSHVLGTDLHGLHHEGCLV